MDSTKQKEQDETTNSESYEDEIERINQECVDEYLAGRGRKIAGYSPKFQERKP
jgi:hypothetical protein